jgi:glycerol-3-phosphate dehydrogenase
MILAGAKTIADLGRCFGSDLYEAEVRYLMEHEWAYTAADILWRRSKKGLYLSKEEAVALDGYIAESRVHA